MDIRDILIDFSQPFYADKETCEHNVDDYLKTIEKEPLKPQKTAEKVLSDQIDDIELQDYLNMIFNDLQKNAYDLDFHGYHYKQANQIIREYFEEYASQFQKLAGITDEEIELFADNYVGKETKPIEGDVYNAYFQGKRNGVIEGIKAMRDRDKR